LASPSGPGRLPDLPLVFHVAREVMEEFLGDYYEPRPLYGLAKTLLAYPQGFRAGLGNAGFYYLEGGASFYYAAIIYWAVRAGREEGWEAAYEVASLSRRIGLSKDPPLVASLAFPGWRLAAGILELYPVAKLAWWITGSRRLRLALASRGAGYGRRRRRAVEEALSSHGLRWHEVQAAKATRAYRDLLRLAHPRPPSREVEGVWRYILRRAPPPTTMLEAVEAIRGGRVRGPEALALAVDAGVPWEVVRSSVGLRRAPDDLLEEAARRLMGPWDLAMQAGSLAKRLGEERTLHVVAERVRAGQLPPPAASARAALGLARRRPRLAEYMFLLAASASRRLWEALHRAGLAVDPRATHYLVDMSGSMLGSPARAAARILLSLRVETAYVFNTEVRIKQVEFRGLQDYLRLLKMPDGGTPLYDSIAWMLQNVVGEGETLIVLTDEQENSSLIDASNIRELARNKQVIIVTLAPYPADYLPKGTDSNIVGVPGATVDAVMAGAAIASLQLFKEQAGPHAKEKLLEAMRRAARQLTAPEDNQ